MTLNIIDHFIWYSSACSSTYYSPLIAFLVDVCMTKTFRGNFSLHFEIESWPAFWARLSISFQIVVNSFVNVLEVK